MKSAPLVSVCIPTYNGMPYLADALASVTAQSHPNIEIVLSDDGSTDGTLDVLDAFGRDHGGRVRIYRHERLGISGNCNFCIEHSRGDYVKLLMQDDLLAPTCVTKLMALAETDNRIGLVFSPRKALIEEDPDRGSDAAAVGEIASWSRDIHLGWTRLRRVQSGRVLLRDPVLMSGNVNRIGEPTVVLLRRRALADMDLFDPDLKWLLDLDLWWRIMCRWHVGFVDGEYLSTFRVHPRQASVDNTRGDVHRTEFIHLYRKMIGDRSYRGLPIETRWRAERALSDLLDRPLTLKQKMTARIEPLLRFGYRRVIRITKERPIAHNV